MEVGGTDSWLLREDGSDPIVLSDVKQAQFTADGKSILYAAGASIRKRAVEGSDDLELVALDSSFAAEYPTESPSGDRFAYIERDASWTRTLFIKEYAGQPQAVSVTLPGENIETIGWSRWSPDGARLALFFETRDATGNNIKRLMVVNPDGSNPEIVTVSQSDVERGDWSPDSTRLLHETDEKNIGWTDVSTKTTTTVLTATGQSVDDPILSADGRKILYRSSSQSAGSGIRLATIDQDGTVTGDTSLLIDASELAPQDWNPACN